MGKHNRRGNRHGGGGGGGNNQGGYNNSGNNNEGNYNNGGNNYRGNFNNGGGNSGGGRGGYNGGGGRGNFNGGGGNNNNRGGFNGGGNHGGGGRGNFSGGGGNNDNRGNYNSGHNQNRGRNNFNSRGNNQNGGDKYCNNCGHNRSHETQDCRKNGNNNQTPNGINNTNNHNNRNNGNNNHNQNSHGNNSGGFNQPLPCPRCGLSGHTRQHCGATEVPLNQRCGCGCDFHRPNQCPWNHDPLERGAYEVPGMICQWCKDVGDGLHDHNDCVEMKRFRAEVILSIQRSYDVLKWCWHCSSTNHLTRVCQSNAADEGKVKWTLAVTAIITAWLQQDLSISSPWYRDRDNDATMLHAVQEQRPPIPADFKWCILCEKFGHFVLNDPLTCNNPEYERRCPPEFRNTAFNAPQPFVPVTPHKYFTRAARLANPVFNQPHPAHPIQSYSKCQNDACDIILGPWEYPLSKLGQIKICPLCKTHNLHPAESWVLFHRMNGHRVEELADDYDEDGDGVKTIAWNPTAAELIVKRKRKRSRDDEGMNPYRKRPSSKLSTKLAITKESGWPGRQPIYNDLTALLNLPEVFRNDGSYFNEPGNHQTYFPAAMIAIHPDMKRVARNDNLPINRAGYLGMRARCTNCKHPIAVLDDEGDVVMCGNTGWCGLGCGLGTMFWYDPYCSQVKVSCRCLSILGQDPVVEWVSAL